jgi:hypothetical protein
MNLAFKPDANCANEKNHQPRLRVVAWVSKNS